MTECCAKPSPEEPGCGYRCFLPTQKLLDEVREFCLFQNSGLEDLSQERQHCLHPCSRSQAPHHCLFNPSLPGMEVGTV